MHGEEYLVLHRDQPCSHAVVIFDRELREQDQVVADYVEAGE